MVKKGSVETNMNHDVLTQTMKIRSLCDELPASGPLRGTAGLGRLIDIFSHLIRRGGVPSGAAEFIITDR